MGLMKLWDSKTNLFEEAKGLYGLNKSFREIEAELHIPRSTLNRRALKEGWKKGYLMPLVHQIIKNQTMMEQLTPEQQKEVVQRVQRKLKLHDQYKAAPSPWLKKLIAAR
jgi:hypothetical protein